MIDDLLIEQVRMRYLLPFQGHQGCLVVERLLRETLFPQPHLATQRLAQILCAVEPASTSNNSHSGGPESQDGNNERPDSVDTASAPGKVAADGPRGQRNSPFIKHLLQVMKQPNLPIEEVFNEVRHNVRRETGARRCRGRAQA
jgi:hypothetical protein